jgi:hypothetical protein
MDEEQIPNLILDHGWTEASLREARAVLEAVERSPALRRMLEDYDSIRGGLVDAAYVTEASEAPAAAPEPPRGWARFESDLRHTLVPRHRGGRAWTWSVAAALLVAATGWVVTTRSSRSAPRGAAVLVEGEVRERAKMFREVDGVLDRRLAWVAEARGHSEVGLRSSDERPTRLIVLRLELDPGNAGEPALADLAIVPGEAATLELPLADGKRIRYHVATSAGTPARISLWAELALPQGGGALAELATTLPETASGAVQAGTLLTPAGRYQLGISRRETRLGPI